MCVGMARVLLWIRDILHLSANPNELRISFPFDWMVPKLDSAIAYSFLLGTPEWMSSWRLSLAQVA